MKKLSRSLLLLLPLCLGACGYDSTENSELDAVTNETRVVLHDFSAFGGFALTATVSPAQLNASATKVISLADIEAAGLRNKISSATITCGARVSQVLFSDSATAWGNRILVKCNPGETKKIDFTQSPNSAGKFLSDRVAWVSLLAHTAKHQSFDFSPMVTTAFDIGIRSRLPAKVTLARTSQTNWIDSKNFEIKQVVNIADPACTGKKIYGRYKVNLSTVAVTGGVKAKWKVSSPQAVFSDSVCAGKYKALLDGNLAKNVAYVQSQMNKAGQRTKRTYYLTPSDVSDRIYGSWGNL